MKNYCIDDFVPRLIVGDPSVVGELLQSGVGLNVAGSTGRTPLMIAASEGHNDLVRSLLESGASVGAVGEQNMTALHEAASNGHASIALALLNSGAEVDAVTIDGVTPLMCAAAWGHLQTVQLLIQCKSKIEICDMRGATALDIAHEKGMNGVADYLENASDIHAVQSVNIHPSQATDLVRGKQRGRSEESRGVVRKRRSVRQSDRLGDRKAGDMQNSVSGDAVVVSVESFRSEDPAEVVQSNITFVNKLFDEYLNHGEIPADALRSYYVDYYLAQVNNGGFSQFVYNSRWSEAVVESLREGLRAMGANRHLLLLADGARLVQRLGRMRLDAYFESEYFGENPDRDELNAPNDQFAEISEAEDLLALNAAWLRRLPNLVVMTAAEMKEEARCRGQALPDRPQRIAIARANEPRYMKLIRALCERAGHELTRITAGDPTQVHEGVQTLAWHFLTDQGHHYMVEAGGKAIMFRGFSETDRVCEVDAPSEMT